MNKHFLTSVFCLGALVSGCQQDNTTTSTLSGEQAVKSTLAIVPLIDNSDQSLGWNISEEITYTLCSKLDQKNLFDLALPSQIRSQTKRMKGKNNPFGEDISWIKQVFSEEDFIVFLELLEHKEVPKETTKPTPPSMLAAELKMGLRIRIIDNRGDTPKVTLQEILQDSHFIPRQFNQYNFDQCSWDSEEFGLSPVGIAHSQLIKELKDRIESYILLAKVKK
ncbi:MAG: CT253 family lipoprotein [Chlamydiota bacterium]